jgi:Putative Flp pilus-assembly TadE/G-like
MRNLLRCHRGSVAFATVIALVPLIGVVALGAEAGSWYVTRQSAQNAADAAAYSGALRLACSNAPLGSSCDTAQDYVYRGKQFADQNKFCDPRDTSYPCASSPPTGTTQTVGIDQPTSSRVRAVVAQQQPTYLAAVLGLSTVTVRAQAIAEVKNPKDLCALGLGPNSNALTIGGSSTITGNGCGLMSDNSVKYNSTPNFSGSGWAVDGVTGCVASAGHCAISVPSNYNMLPATNPLKVLDSETFNTRTGPVTKPCGNGKVTNGNTCTLDPNSAGGVYDNLTVNGGAIPGTLNFKPGTYFFYNSAIDFSGTVACPTCACPTPTTCTGVTLVLLGNSSLKINSGTVNLSAPATNTFSSDLNGVLIDDQASGAVSIGGGSTSTLGGAMYFPNANVSYGGTAQNTNTTCTEVIANTITINGNAFLSTQNCAPGTVAFTQVVALVQ